MNGETVSELRKRKREDRDKLETELFYIGILLLVAGIGIVAAYYFWLRRFLPQVPCIFLQMAGIYCPGCGGTRAVTALLHGRILQAVWYHPLVPYTAVVAGGFLLTQGLERMGVKGVRGWRYHNWYLYGAVALVMGNFLLKNLLKVLWGITM